MSVLPTLNTPQYSVVEMPNMNVWFRVRHRPVGRCPFPLSRDWVSVSLASSNTTTRHGADALNLSLGHSALNRSPQSSILLLAQPSHQAAEHSAH